MKTWIYECSKQISLSKCRSKCGRCQPECKITFTYTYIKQIVYYLTPTNQRYYRTIMHTQNRVLFTIGIIQFHICTYKMYLFKSQIFYFNKFSACNKNVNQIHFSTIVFISLPAAFRLFYFLHLMKNHKILFKLNNQFKM